MWMLSDSIKILNLYMKISHHKYLATLTIIFSVVFLILSISPHDRSDWALENVLVLVFVIVISLSYKKFPLSRISYTLIFIFLCLHEVGAHYTYAKVPYNLFFIDVFGINLNDLMGWERNHFDRLVHFLFGLLLAYPIREIYCRIADSKGFWAYFFPLELTMAASMMFELFEWGAATIFGGELGIAYLGAQGDIWDAHKDMALASLGAFLAMSITLLINLRIQKNFREEWVESLSIKNHKPLGEDEIIRLIQTEKE
jgi:putative membrane protein